MKAQSLYPVLLAPPKLAAEIEKASRDFNEICAEAAERMIKLSDGTLCLIVDHLGTERNATS